MVNPALPTNFQDGPKPGWCSVYALLVDKNDVRKAVLSSPAGSSGVPSVGLKCAGSFETSRLVTYFGPQQLTRSCYHGWLRGRGRRSLQIPTGYRQCQTMKSWSSWTSPTHSTACTGQTCCKLFETGSPSCFFTATAHMHSRRCCFLKQM